jgi:hypothetical protein
MRVHETLADEFNGQLQSRYAHISKSLGQISYVNAFYLKRKTSIHSELIDDATSKEHINQEVE